MVNKEMSDKVKSQIEETKERVARLHAELPKWELVVWTAGNVSERVPGTNYFVIKPSGVRYEELSPDNMIVCDLNGEKIEGEEKNDLKPSSDTAAHAYVYRHMPEVGGVVHTHSTFATAFAAARKTIPCMLTMTGDEFGGEIPIGPLAIIGDDSIGEGIVSTLSSSRSPAVLMANHGPFTIGKNAEAAVKAAVMVEEVARTTFNALQLGATESLDPAMVDKLWERYQNVYGQ